MSNQRVRALLDLGRFSEAERLAQAEIAQTPDDPQLFAMLSYALIRQNRPKESRKAAEAALGLQPDHAWAIRLLGISLRSLGQPKQALELFDRAVQLQPFAAEVFANRADCLVALGRGARERSVRSDSAKSRDYFSRAESDLRHALELAPTNADFHVSMAELHLARDDNFAAERAAKDALAIDPQHADAHLILGRVAQATGSVGRAGEHFVAAGRADPTDDRALAHLRKIGSRAAIPGGITAFVVVRAIARAGTPDDLAVAVVGVVLGLLIIGGAYYVYNLIGRRRARSQLSSTAQDILETDRSTRRRRRPGG